MYINFIIFFILLAVSLIFICRKSNLFVDFKLEKHKRHSSKSKSFSIGGLLLIFFLFYHFLYLEGEYLIFFYLFSIFLIGFLSDLKKLNSVSLRFFLQFILIIFFSQILNIEIKTTKIEFVDYLLSNTYFNSAFVTFCLMVFINGGNFIDGLNTLLIKYFIIIYLILLIPLGTFLIDDLNFIKNLILILTILFCLNSMGIIYMGDSGAYLLSILTGYILISFSSDNLSISPYFIIILLWYPCFELLFSMIRRKLSQKKTYKPDTRHLHQMLNDFLNYKFKINNYKFSHLYTSIIINLYNLIIFVISTKFIYNSEILIAILIINILFYFITYSFLKKIVVGKLNY
tara:strand:- start:799 stop:1830 length:1032 start_codon:yes stop_codon:yes gene_type:complete